jgi:hypothetical protein
MPNLTSGGGISDAVRAQILQSFKERYGDKFDRAVFDAALDAAIGAGVTVISGDRIANHFLQATISAYDNGGTLPAGSTDGNGDFTPPPPPSDTGTGSPKNTAASFTYLLQSWGIPLDDSLSALVKHAADKGWNQQRLIEELMKTPEFDDRFPGILAADGTLTMSPTQYLASEKQFQAAASRAGINLSDGKEAWLFQHGITPSLFADRATGFKMLQDNKDFYEQYGKSLVQQGVATPQDIKDEGLFKFVMGEANQEWYDTYNLTRARYAATQAGIRLSAQAEGDMILNPHLIERISNKGLSDADLTQGFQQVAQQLLTTLPLSRIQKYGLSKHDIAAAEFGGPKQAQIKAKMEHILAQEKAFEEQGAQGPQSYVTQGGTPASAGVSQQRRQYSQ